MAEVLVKILLKVQKSNMRIKEIHACAILDSRGHETVETTLRTDSLEAIASVPSGKSTGSHEAKELRDADGGVSGVCVSLEGEIFFSLSEKDFASTKEIDDFLIDLDGTPDKSRLGANAILSVSIAASRLFAQEAGVPLWRYLADTYGTTPSAPHLFVNVMNGGEHADFRLPIQEYLFVVGEKTVTESVKTAETAFATLGEMLRKETNELPMGDEGGYSPKFEAIERPFEILSELVSAHPNTSIAIDAAANGLRDGTDAYKLLDKKYTPSELQELYETLVSKFPFHAIEDPFAEDDVDRFVSITAALGDKVLVIGDDLIVTDTERVEDAISKHSINAVLIKPNQIGTVSEAAKAVLKTHSAGWATVCSHRSGETEDTFIADFAYGMGSHGIKAGGFGQMQRRRKYERLQEIETELN